MSIIKTVQYEINEDGDCGECKSMTKWGTETGTGCNFYCTAFDELVGFYTNYALMYNPKVCIQCQACTDFIAEKKEKSEVKIYCDGCKYFVSKVPYFKNNYDRCKLSKPQLHIGIGQDYFDNSKWYSLNCKSKE